MKKNILYTLALLSLIMSSGVYAGAVAESCSNFGSGSSGCAKCFRESDNIYGCNPHQSCNQYYGLNYLSDTMVNTGTVTKIMYSSPADRAGRVEFARLQTQTDWSLSSADMFRVPSTFSPLYTGTTGIYYMLNGGASVKWIETKPGEFIRLNGVTAGASRTQPAYKISFIPRTYDLISQGNLGPAVDHRQCLFIYPRFCGDGVIDSDRTEQCDDGNMNSGDGCSNTCQTEVTPVCNNLIVTPTSVTNGGTVAYTCSGTNATSYSIIAKRPDGTTLTSSTSAAGSIILPATPTGNYTVSCYVNGQVTTPTSCEKTVTNTTVNEPVCTDLSITPTSVTNGGNVTYTCSGNNVSSYSVVFTRPDGSVLQSFATQGGSVTIPATPTGTYTAKCFVNGQTTTPSACQKTVTNTTVNEPVCTDLSITPTSVTNGGNVTYTCSGNNVSSYSVVFTRPDGSVLQSFATQGGSVTIPATPTGTYTAKCFVNGQTTTPSACQKTVTNTTVNEPVCTDLSITPTSVTNGGNVTYTCSGNNVSSYSVVFTRPDGSVLQSFATQGGSVTIPATPTGTYTAKCFVNGQTTTPSACQKTVSNNTYNNPTCDNLSISTSGTTVNYSCSGSGGITNYSIHQNGNLISNASSGSINVGYGTHTFSCYVNNSITSSSCQKTVTINNNPQPQIQVVKDDNDNHDDSQFLQNGSAAQFTIVVRNPGSEPLDSVTLSDPYAPECNRGSYETQNMIVNVGNRDTRLDPGESFSYVCVRSNTDQYTFPNNENRICVNGRGITSGIAVNSCDTTRIGFGTPVSTCQNMQVSQNGNQTNVYCSPTGGYKLFVLQGKQVINTLQNPTGQFSLSLNDGTYKVVCLRDGEQSVQPSCQKSITINPKQNYCELSSTVRYGGAPLRTQLSCTSPTYAQCNIKLWKDGKPWRSVAGCNADIIFTERGVYDASCIVGDADTQSCSTRVQVDVMTIIRTGPFIPTIVLIAFGMAAYITYRRRKTA